MPPRERVEPREGNFYLVGLGLLMEGVQFTQDERLMLEFLCKHAAKGDDQYLEAIKIIKADLASFMLLERLKSTLRTIGKGPVLEAYYDRAA